MYLSNSLQFPTEIYKIKAWSTNFVKLDISFNHLIKMRLFNSLGIIISDEFDAR